MDVERVDGVDNHKHKEDHDFVEEASTNYKWTNDMEEVFKNRIINHKKALKYILFLIFKRSRTMKLSLKIWC